MGRKRRQRKRDRLLACQRKHQRQSAPAVNASLIDGLVAHFPPDLQGVLRAALPTIMTDAFRRVMAGIDTYRRASVLVAWKEAVAGLQSGRACDFCPANATAVRFIVAENPRGIELAGSDNAMVGFTLLCGRCAALPDREIQRKMIDAYARSAPADGKPFWRPTFVGQEVGAATILPRRHSLQACQDCGSTIWIDQDDAEQASDSLPIYLCIECARTRHEAGRLEVVPDFSAGFSRL